MTTTNRRPLLLTAIGIMLIPASAAFALLDILPLPKQSQPGVQFAVTEDGDEELIFDLTLDEKALGFPVGNIFVGSYRKAPNGKIATVSSYYSTLHRSAGKIHTCFRLDRKLAADTRIGLDTSSPLGFGGVQMAFRLSDFVILGFPGEVPREKLFPYTVPNTVESPVPTRLRVRPKLPATRKEGLEDKRL